MRGVIRYILFQNLPSPEFFYVSSVHALELFNVYATAIDQISRFYGTKRVKRNSNLSSNAGKQLVKPVITSLYKILLI